MRNRILVAAFAALVGCGGNDVTCGDGTTLVDGVCQASGSAGGDTCGSGTMLSGTTCVPVNGGSGVIAGSPTISDLMTNGAGVAGGATFQIDGNGFAGDNVTETAVFFGETQDSNCLAALYQVTPTQIFGEVPQFCDINVTVTVATNVGAATTPFHYDAIFAADGEGGGNFGGAGELWIIDPFSATAFDFGPLMETTESTAYGISGIAFDGSGTLWGVTTGDSDGDDGTSQLVTIDPSTPDISTVSVVGDVTDAAGNAYTVDDIKFVNGVLYGWAYIFSDGDSQQGLITIDLASGSASIVGTPAEEGFGLGGLLVDGSGAMWVAANGAGSDDVSVVPATGEIDSIDPMTGTVTAGSNALDWPIGAPINAMDYFATVQSSVAVVDNGIYGLVNNAQISGETLAVIDPASGDVEPVFELPAQSLQQSAVDGIAIPSSPTVSIAIAKKAHAAKAQQLKTVAPPKRAAGMNGAHLTHRHYR